MVVAFTGVLELHLHQVGIVHIAWHVSQPVIGVQLSVLSSYGFFAESTVAASHYI